MRTLISKQFLSVLTQIFMENRKDIKRATVPMKAAEQKSTLPTRLMSLNKKGDSVRELHNALKTMGYTIDQTELDELRFGKSTAAAVAAIQESNGLATTGKFDSDARKALRNAMLKKNPSLKSSMADHCLRGSVFSREGKALSGALVSISYMIFFKT